MLSKLLIELNIKNKNFTSVLNCSKKYTYTPVALFLHVRVKNASVMHVTVCFKGFTTYSLKWLYFLLVMLHYMKL